MFATLLGALPMPARDAGDLEGAGDGLEGLIRAAIRAQEAAGLEPITDGRLRGYLADRVPDAAAILEAWRFAAAATDRAVKQVVPGPYTIGRRAAGNRAAARDRARGADGSTAAEALGAERAASTERAGLALRAIVVELAEAGCPLIEIEEADAHTIGDDPAERQLFREAHGRLVEGLGGTHLSLSIVGGSAWGAGLETILDAPYSSLAVDLIAGPDNWNLVTRLPGDRGVIAGALPAKDSPADAKETLLWAARYAAGSKRRGLDRVGLGSAGSWANLTWEAALVKMHRLGEAARLAATPGGTELARQLDPRAVSARTAALGQVRPRRQLRPRREPGAKR